MPLCAKIKRKDAERKRRVLAEKGAIDHSYIPSRDRKFVYFAVKGKPCGVRLVKKRLKRREVFAKPFAEELKGKLTAREREELVTSFDLVGDIAVVEVPPSLVKKEKLIAMAIMKQHHGVKSVAKKTGGTAGEFRIRPVKVIAGERRTSTAYREGGCEFELDLNKTYFSPRLGTERGRLCALVKEGERVLVPFAGVGPFAIRIGKAVPSAQVVGIELNHDACKYFRKNIARNRCANVSLEEGDAEKILRTKFKGWADRLAMPLPKDAKHFLPAAICALKKGGTLHYYSFGKADAPFEEAEKDVLQAASSLGRRAQVIFRRVVRPYSKTTEQVAIDAAVI
jgi:tRNA (guanine37-N1)-methyltransferase